MENIRFHEVKPMNDKTTFKGDDLVDFEISANGRQLVRNSVELVGDVQVYKNVLPPLNDRVIGSDAGKLFVNKNAGAHSFIESISTTTINQGNIESIGFAYPRFVNMMKTLKQENQNLNNIDDVLSWSVPDKDLTDNFLRQIKLVTGAAPYNEDPSFNIKPMIVLNRTNSNISLDKTGKIRVSLNLSSDEKALENALEGISGLNYTITNLKLRFRSVPDDGKASDVVAQKMTVLKTSVNSGSASMSFNVPSKSATGCSISFQSQANEGNQASDNFQLEKINIDSVQYFFNSANTYLNYKLDNTSEILMRGLKSIAPMNDESTYEVKQSDLSSNSSLVIGSDFDGIVNLSENSFEVELVSSISNTTNVYLLFHSLLSM